MVAVVPFLLHEVLRQPSLPYSTRVRRGRVRVSFGGEMEGGVVRVVVGAVTAVVGEEEVESAGAGSIGRSRAPRNSIAFTCNSASYNPLGVRVLIAFSVGHVVICSVTKSGSLVSGPNSASLYTLYSSLPLEMISCSGKATESCCRCGVERQRRVKSAPG